MLNLPTPVGYDRLSVERKFTLASILKKNEKAMEKMSPAELQELVSYQTKQLMIANNNIFTLIDATKEIKQIIAQLKSGDTSLMDYKPIDPERVEGFNELPLEVSDRVKTFLGEQLSTCKENNKADIISALQLQSVITYVLAARLAATEDALEDICKIEI